MAEADAGRIGEIFRHQSGRAVATLVRRFGDIDLAEEAVQDAFTVALERWPDEGLPPNPGAWITTTARNRTIDRLRRESSRRDRHVQAVLERAKRKIKAAKVPYRVPGDAELRERLGPVLAVVYLVFNEGYAASAGDDAVRTELCAEAIRLVRLLVELMPDEPEVVGLLALLLLTESRRAASYHPFHVARADLLRRLGRNDEAADDYDAALSLGPNRAERAFLEGRRNRLRS